MITWVRAELGFFNVDFENIIPGITTSGGWGVVRHRWLRGCVALQLRGAAPCALGGGLCGWARGGASRCS